MKTVSDETVLDCVRQGTYVGVWSRVVKGRGFTAWNPAPVRLCAHDDEALIDVFVKLLREAIRSR